MTTPPPPGPRPDPLLWLLAILGGMLLAAAMVARAMR
jgi:hypothetical protein